jgi:hypothetical protein
MRFTIPVMAALAALAFAAACSDSPVPTTPTSTTGPVPAPAALQSMARGRQERMARRLALALRRPDIRQSVRSYLDGSPDPEGKISFRWLLAAGQGQLRRALAEASGDPDAAIQEDADGLTAMELYLPVAAHRAQWRGGESILVATAIQDGETPVAFDTRGVRRLLDPNRPPVAPVLALVPAEQAYVGAYPGSAPCMTPGCSGGMPTAASGGLYMTSASFTGTFESWLKGNPEFETHILGQDGSTATLKDYQCAGEHAGGAYVYDQNGKTWSGSVLLFSQGQLDAFKAAHPDQAVRVLVLEDDDGACQIKTGKDQLSLLFKSLDAAYSLWTGGKQDLLNLTKLFKRATMLQQLFTSTASLINSNDEVVGNAIEDIVAGQTWPGSNWIVKGGSNITNGGIKLEMR